MEKETNVLFGYSCTPAWGLYGIDPGGFSIELDISGLVRYKTYIFDLILQRQRIVQLSPRTVEKINEILNNNRDNIKKIGKYLDNGSCDGVCNRFNFMGKVITGYNVSFSDEESLSKYNPEYYAARIKNIRQENAVSIIFNSIAIEMQDELKAEGLELNLFTYEYFDID